MDDGRRLLGKDRKSSKKRKIKMDGKYEVLAHNYGVGLYKEFILVDKELGDVYRCKFTSYELLIWDGEHWQCDHWHNILNRMISGKMYVRKIKNRY